MNKMSKQDLADFISGERAAIEGVLRNLSLVLYKFNGQAIDYDLVHWATTLETINRQMSLACENLRRG